MATQINNWNCIGVSVGQHFGRLMVATCKIKNLHIGKCSHSHKYLSYDKLAACKTSVRCVAFSKAGFNRGSLQSG